MAHANCVDYIIRSTNVSHWALVQSIIEMGCIRIYVYRKTSRNESHVSGQNGRTRKPKNLNDSNFTGTAAAAHEAAFASPVPAAGGVPDK